MYLYSPEKAKKKGEELLTVFSFLFCFLEIFTYFATLSFETRYTAHTHFSNKFKRVHDRK